MPDMEYVVAGLRNAASEHAEAAVGAEATVSALAGLAVVASAFGGVPAAARFSTGVDTVRQDFGRAASAEMYARHDVADRVRTTGDLGAGLTATSTAVAASVPGSVSAGMM